MPRFNRVVNSAFILSIVTFIFMMGIGFLTFGGNSAGFVLNNFSGADNLATMARVAIGTALLTGYPFTFSALKEGVLDLAGVTGEKRNTLLPSLTFGLLGLVTGLALVLKDVGFVVSFAGALFGAALMFMVPAYMNICLVKSKVGSGSLTKGNKLEIASNYGIIGTGFVMAALGVTISVLRQLKKL
jgi:sodium-coupled neutral amino acid transporter 11